MAAASSSGPAQPAEMEDFSFEDDAGREVAKPPVEDRGSDVGPSLCVAGDGEARVKGTIFCKTHKRVADNVYNEIKASTGQAGDEWDEYVALKALSLQSTSRALWRRHVRSLGTAKASALTSSTCFSS